MLERACVTWHTPLRTAGSTINHFDVRGRRAGPARTVFGRCSPKAAFWTLTTLLPRTPLLAVHPPLVCCVICNSVPPCRQVWFLTARDGLQHCRRLCLTCLCASLHVAPRVAPDAGRARPSLLLLAVTLGHVRLFDVPAAPLFERGQQATRPRGRVMAAQHSCQRDFVARLQMGACTVYARPRETACGARPLYLGPAAAAPGRRLDE